MHNHRWATFLTSLLCVLPFHLVGCVSEQLSLELRTLEQRTALRYDVIDLGTLGGTFSYPQAINAAGDVVGRSQTASDEIHAFLWRGGALLDLGTLGGSNSTAADINDRGQVVGEAAVSAVQRRAFLWQDGEMIDLGTSIFGSSKAVDINNRGQVLIDTGSKAFLWDSGQVHDLGHLGGFSSLPVAINDAGQVVGQSKLVDGRNRAFMWEDGIMRDLGTLGGDQSFASGLNESGQVIGRTQKADGRFAPFLWSNGQMLELPTEHNAAFVEAINNSGVVVGFIGRSAGRWENGVLQELGSGSGFSIAYDINDEGLAVGRQTGRAMLWTRTDTIDLTENSFLQSSSSRAEKINASGQIVGTYNFSRAFVASPANGTPTADAGPDQVVECADELGLATLDGSNSTDPDEDPLSFLWSGPFVEGDGQVSGVNASVTLPNIGENEIILTVDDGQGATATDTVLITVVDSLPPEARVELVPMSSEDEDDDDSERFSFRLMCEDRCGGTSSADAELFGQAIVDGQVIEYEQDDEQDVEMEDGVLKVEAPSLRLTLRCVDDSENSTEEVVELLVDSRLREDSDD